MTTPNKHLKGRQCWVCGIREGLTKAHVLPQMLNPKKNIKIPLCVECHRKVDLRFQFQRQLRDARATLREMGAIYLARCRADCSFCHDSLERTSGIGR